MASLAVALAMGMLLLGMAAAPAAATTYPPGQQPGSNGQPEPCPTGTYKGYTGDYHCTACASGSIAPTTGRRTCIKCAAHKTSNTARTYCVYVAGYVAPKPTTTYPPGQQPGSDGKAEPCPKGTYKGYTGNYHCTACASGSIAPTTGRRTCIKCAAHKTSNTARTYCVYVAGYVAPTPAPTPAPGAKPTRSAAELAFAAAVKADSSVYHPATPCQSNSDGATRCGIPVGYAGIHNRTGTVYFPKTYKNKAIPYMILLHGAGIDGDTMINTFQNTANTYQYGIVAPDSRYDLYWDVPTTGTSTWTHDFYHIQACWDRVLKFPGVVVDPSFITIVGNSRAGYAAPAFGSRTTIGINSCIIIHAAALASQMGYKHFPIYWSTGYSDPLYGPIPPARGNTLRVEFMKYAPQFPITYRVWQGSHTIRNYTELNDWSVWWLNPSQRSKPAPPLHRRRRMLAAPAAA